MRIGSIQYINSLPVDFGFLSGNIPFSAEVVRGVPADLNQKMLDGLLDISPVSVFWYARHQSRFLVLPNISISSESGAQSVLLFSRYPLKELAGKTIALTGEGRTTPVLLEILCRKFWGFEPHFKNLENLQEDILKNSEAALLIGDQALLHRRKFINSGLYITDLAEEWRRLTGLGFVFAVWVCQSDFFKKSPEIAKGAYETILLSKKWGLSHRQEIMAEARWRTTLPEAELNAYFSCLSYELDSSLLRGMALYFQYACELGLLPPLEPMTFLERNLDSEGKYVYNKLLSRG